MRCLAFVVATVLSVHSAAEAVLNGIGRFEQLGEVQFMGALYSESPSASAARLLAGNGRQRIEIRVAKSRIFAKRFRQWWIDGVAINNRASVLRSHIDNFTYFTNLFDFKLVRGDHIVIARTPDSGVDFVFNTETIGHVDDPDFFNLLLSSWIGDVSLSTDFRDHLLAGGDIDAALRQQFDDYMSAAERVAMVASVAPPEDLNAAVADGGAEVAVASSAVAESVKKVSIKTGASITPAVKKTTAVTQIAMAVPKPAVLEQQAVSEPEPVATPVDAAPTPRVPGVSAEALLRHQQYVNHALTWTNKHSRYPRRALATRQQGLVLLNVTLDREGKVQEVTVVQESEHSLLNKAAVRAVKKASPFPPPPGTEDRFNLMVPISFKLVADLPG